jgi:hypothetical protein
LSEHRESTGTLKTLAANWLAVWPQALERWNRYVQLSEPRWCFTAEEEAREELTGSFAMIRLVDHAVVVSLRQIAERGLESFAMEILAHEIGHHVFCPADLTDNARLLARMRADLPTKEHLAPFIANLYTDLMINDRLQRLARLNVSGVYLRLASKGTDRMWTLYMRIYEWLWNLPRAALALGTLDQHLDYDAQLGARLTRTYAKDWLEGAGRFAVLCLSYLLEDDAKAMQGIIGPWLDTTAAGKGGIPEGLYGSAPDDLPHDQPIDLYLGVDCSGSMKNPALGLSYPVLAGTIIALSALRAGSHVMVVLSGEPGKTVSTEGFIRDEREILKVLTGYLGTGYTFGVHRLHEPFSSRTIAERPVHILIVTDNDIFNLLDAVVAGQLGWDVAREAVAKARGGATYVLEIPERMRGLRQSFVSREERMQTDGWRVQHVTSMEELLDFARRFSQAAYGKRPTKPMTQDTRSEG